jgi:putative acetyltransferase
LAEYGLSWQPEEAEREACLSRSVWDAERNRDVLEIEKYYLQTGGEFWVVERENKIVGTAGYYPIARGEEAVEIRKMYLLPMARGQGLGKYLLQQLEAVIFARKFQQIWIETASVLTEAVRLYEQNGYQPATGVETKRCDRVYLKSIRT